MLLNLVTLSCILSALVQGSFGSRYYYVTKGSTWQVGNGKVSEDSVTDWIAKAYYNASYYSTGWDILEIKSNYQASDGLQMFGAGYIEGYLTYDRIYYFWHNVMESPCLSSVKTCERVKKYWVQNTDYVRKLAEENLSDPYWYQVHLFYKQVEGIHKGYTDAPKNQSFSNLTFTDIIWLNFLLEIDSDLSPAFENATEKRFVNTLNHCSALIKLLPGFKDVIFGHSMWGKYSMMHRIMKRYSLPVRESNVSNKLVPGMITMFPSYPGSVTSQDDFYLISSGLFAMETTNAVYNINLYSNMKASQVSESIRSMVANRLATNGSSWNFYFKKLNNGAYNNQWMILDLNKFRPGFQPKEGFLWIIEQMPDLMIGFDQTDVILKKGYWASYNEPFYKDIYNYSGSEAQDKETGSYNSHEFSPRAKMFKRDQNTVRDVESMYHLLRYNDYKNDPYSVCYNCVPKRNPGLALASRFDLIPMNETGYSLFGAIDAKASSYGMFIKEEILAVSGPTNENVPAFKWQPFHNVSHLGQPEVWQFPPILTEWKLEDDSPESSSHWLHPPHLIVYISISVLSLNLKFWF